MPIVVSNASAGFAAKEQRRRSLRSWHGPETVPLARFRALRSRVQVAASVQRRVDIFATIGGPLHFFDFDLGETVLDIVGMTINELNRRLKVKILFCVDSECESEAEIEFAHIEQWANDRRSEGWEARVIRAETTLGYTLVDRRRSFVALLQQRSRASAEAATRVVEQREWRIVYHLGNKHFIKGLLAEIRIPIPPFPLQQQFAMLVVRHECLRAVQRESLRQAEHFFQALLCKVLT